MPRWSTAMTSKSRARAGMTRRHAYQLSGRVDVPAGGPVGGPRGEVSGPGHRAGPLRCDAHVDPFRRPGRPCERSIAAGEAAPHRHYLAFGTANYRVREIRGPYAGHDVRDGSDTGRETLCRS